MDLVGDPLLLLAAAAVTFLAAGVQGVTGFGHALIAIGLLSLLFGSKEAVLVLTLLAPFISVALFVRMWRHVAWAEAAWLCVPLLIGLVPGLLLFSILPADTLRRLVGGLLLVFTVWYASPISPRPRRLGRGWAVASGSSAGFLGGLTSTGGPPVVLYLLVHDQDKRRSLAILQAVFVVGSVAKAILAGAAGLYTGPLLALSAILVIPLLAGVLLGQRAFDRLDATLIRRLSLGLLAVMGLALLAGL